MKTSEKCANGCIPSSPHVGCPVHSPAKCTCMADFVVYGTCDYCCSRPRCPHGSPAPRRGEVLDCGCSGGPSALLTGMYAKPPPEPALDEDGTVNTDAGIQIEMLEAQLAAAQARAKELEAENYAFREGVEDASQAATERAERLEREETEWQREIAAAVQLWPGWVPHWKWIAEVAALRVAERDAAIKAKEEAERARDGYCSSLAKTCVELEAERKQVEFLNARISQLLDTAKREGMLLERDGFGKNERAEAERKRADELQRQVAEDTQRLDTWSARVVKAEATAGALRAALEAIAVGPLGLSQFSYEDFARVAIRLATDALTAHSKAVGP